MNKPITLCDRCKEYARCALNYDGDNCRRIRTVEPTNADRIRSMSDEELAKQFNDVRTSFKCVICGDGKRCFGFDECEDCWLDWMKQEVT